MKNIRLFIKPYCHWCHQAQNWLDQRGVRYETHDVIANRDAMKEMVGLSGQTLAPVIEVGGRILADFGPDELEAFWAKISATDGHR
jgi:glutaredoxin